jgi:hypothetical protein
MVPREVERYQPPQNPLTLLIDPDELTPARTLYSSEHLGLASSDTVTPNKAVEAMSKYGDTVLKTSLSRQGERNLHDALHGQAA